MRRVELSGGAEPAPLEQVLRAAGHDPALVPAGCVFVEGRRARSLGQIVSPGARLLLHLPEAPAPGGPDPAEPALVVIHEDERLIVLDKAPGLHLNETETTPRRSIVERLRAEGHDTFVVHRLDLETSGVVVLAKGRVWAERLSAAFRERRAHKRYLAVATGTLADGTIDAPIARDPRRPRARRVFTSGQPARTDVRVCSAAAGLLAVEARPYTGRTHQIRVHLAHAGAPIFGDVLYGGRAAVRAGGVVLRAPRVLLHAASPELDLGGEVLRYEAPLPADLLELASLGLLFS